MSTVQSIKGIFHVDSISAFGHHLFRRREDYFYFANLFQNMARERSIDILAWALISDEFHFILRDNENTDTLSRFMRDLKSRYAIYLRRTHGGFGHVFGRPYKKTALTTEETLFNCSRFIHALPLHRHLALRPGEWPFCNCCELDASQNRIPECDSVLFADYEKKVSAFASSGQKLDRRFHILPDIGNEKPVG